MPSDERYPAALAALASRRDAFRSALATAMDEISAARARQQGEAANATGRVAMELGSFAAGRIDVERFALQFADAAPLDAACVGALGRALDVLAHLSTRGDELLLLALDAGEDLRSAVGEALADVGRGFAAARAAELARRGQYRAGEHDELFGPFPFHRWSRAERRLAPPLIVSVQGADVAAAGLADFLDGHQQIVLLARGATPPAALVRLITPGVCVVQTADMNDLGACRGHDGPAIVLCVEDGDDAAHFVHDPAAGATFAERLRVTRLPERVKAGSARASFEQRTRELALLQTLRDLAATERAQAGAAADQPGAPPAPDSVVSPADRVAAWLLRQSELSEPAS
jgi:hypothetical protein